MDTQITYDEITLFNDIGTFGASLWEKTKSVEGRSTDPKMFSAMLYTRLWGHHRGYAALSAQGLQLEADIILRAGIEAAICLAANAVLRDEFVCLMRRDAAFTFQRQIIAHRKDGELEAVRSAEQTLRVLQRGLPAGAKAAKLNWQDLADRGNVADLYAQYRMLSGTSSHVTGASVLALVSSEEKADAFHDLRAMQRRLHLMMMAGATLIGGSRHALMLGDTEAVDTVLPLLDRLDSVTAASVAA